MVNGIDTQYTDGKTEEIQVESISHPDFAKALSLLKEKSAEALSIAAPILLEVDMKPNRMLVKLASVPTGFMDDFRAALYQVSRRSWRVEFETPGTGQAAPVAPERDNGHGSFATKLATVKVFRHRLIPSLEIQAVLNVPGQLSPNRKTRSKALVTIPITSRISLSPGVPRIDIQTEIVNTAKDHRLRVHFPAPFAVDVADYDGHYEVVRRPIGVPESTEKWVEQPRPETHQGAFTDISNGKIGLTIANRGLPEVEALNNGGHTAIAVTLLRAVGWLSRDDMPVRQGHAGPAFETPGGQVPGKWTYNYSIIPHKSNWRETCQHAYAFETPLRATTTTLHSGEVAAEGSFISHSPAEFVISAVKGRRGLRGRDGVVAGARGGDGSQGEHDEDDPRDEGVSHGPQG